MIVGLRSLVSRTTRSGTICPVGTDSTTTETAKRAQPDRKRTPDSIPRTTTGSTNDDAAAHPVPGLPRRRCPKATADPIAEVGGTHDAEALAEIAVNRYGKLAFRSGGTHRGRRRIVGGMVHIGVKALVEQRREGVEIVILLGRDARIIVTFVFVVVVVIIIILLIVRSECEW